MSDVGGTGNGKLFPRAAGPHFWATSPREARAHTLVESGKLVGLPSAAAVLERETGARRGFVVPPQIGAHPRDVARRIRWRREMAAFRLAVKAAVANCRVKFSIRVVACHLSVRESVFSYLERL